MPYVYLTASLMTLVCKVRKLDRAVSCVVQDVNGDGMLSFEELRQGLGGASVGEEQGNSLAQELLGALDLSGDGCLDYHEFLAAALDRQRMLTDHTIAEMFGQFLAPDLSHPSLTKYP